MSFIPKPQEIYKHFKGNLYQITAVAEHTETGEQLVIYQALYGDFRTYARPLDMFVSRVDREKYPEAEQEFRFELQGPEADRQKKQCGQEQTEPVESGDNPGKVTERQGDEEAAAVTGVEDKEAGTVQLESAGETAEEIYPEAACEEDEAELTLDPLVLEFLDADSYEQQLNILAGLHHRITDDMITTMAIACDIEIGDGDIEERYEALKSCLLTLERYECNRLR